MAATRIASLAICENQARLKERYGNRLTSTQQKAVKRGEKEHKKHHDNVVSFSDRRCFVASCIFGGEAAETSVLRGFRDQYLLVTWPGRLLVSIYYGTSPKLIPYIEKYPVLRDILSRGLLFIVRVVDKFCVKS